MSTAQQDQSSRNLSCPECGGPLTRSGGGGDHYWSCPDCNLVFLP